jgi:hypothetical protein
MKQRLLTSALLGLVLAAGTLFYHSGDQKLEPIPLHGVRCSAAADADKSPDSGCVGVVALTPKELLSSRGFPLPIVTLEPDDDEAGVLYHGVSVTGILVDYLLAALLVLGALTLVGRSRAPKPAARQK